MAKRLALVLKLSVSLVLIWFLFSKIDVNDVFISWTSFSFIAVLSALFLHLCALTVNVFKWKLFLPEQSFGRLFQFTLIDVFYGMVLPGQVSGEVAKAYRLGKRTGDMKRVAVSVWLDKLTGLIGLIALMVVGMLWSDQIFPTLVYVSVFGLLLVGVGSIYIFDFPLFGRLVEKYLIWDFVKNIFLSLKEFKKNHFLVFVNIILGGFYQIFSILITMVFAAQLGISISIIDWFWIFGLISIVQFMPISFAGLGVREVSFVGILALFTVPATSAVALSLAIFGIQLLFASVGFFVETHYNLSRV